MDLTACEVGDFYWVQTVASFEYRLTQGLVTTIPFEAAQNALTCGFPITYDVEITRDGVPTDDPSVVMDWNPVTNEFTLDTWSKPAIGFYEFRVTATIPQVLLPGGTKTIEFFFNITIVSDCIYSEIIPRTIDDIVAYYKDLKTRDITFQNTRSDQVHGDPTHCGEYRYVFEPAYPLFTTLTGDTTNGFTYEVYTDDLLTVGLFPVTVTVDLPEFPEIAPYTTSFNIFIYCSVTSITEVIPPPPYSEFLIGIDPFLVFPIKYTQFPPC